MNSTTSTNQASIRQGDSVYVPFWCVLDVLDVTPPDPFLKATVLTVTARRLHSPDGPVDGAVCDLELKPGLIATAVPIAYVIQPDQLGLWATRISDWFLSYPGKQTSSHSVVHD